MRAPPNRSFSKTLQEVPTRMRAQVLRAQPRKAQQLVAGDVSGIAGQEEAHVRPLGIGRREGCQLRLEMAARFRKSDDPQLWPIELSESRGPEMMHERAHAGRGLV